MVAKSPRVRLDELLVRRGLAPTRSQARALVLAGQVRVPGAAHLKPGMTMDDACPVEVVPSPAFVSRGGAKLAHALDQFGIEPVDLVCADIGASTGGFTDCLLQRGARRVYAVDVGYGQLDWRLRTDPRVVVMERTNARYLEALPETVDLVVVDASFISLRLLLPACVRVLGGPPFPATRGIVALVKPQFEAGRARVSRGGVVRDPAVHAAVLADMVDGLEGLGLALQGATASPLRGPAGNIEFLVHLGSTALGGASAQAWIDSALSDAARVSA